MLDKIMFPLLQAIPWVSKLLRGYDIFNSVIVLKYSILFLSMRVSDGKSFDLRSY